MNERKRIVFGALGTEKDKRATGQEGLNKWRPTVDLCKHDDFPISRYELFYQKEFEVLARQVKEDIEAAGQTKVRLNKVDFKGNPWKLEHVYAAFFDFFSNYDFDHEKESYFLNISTGTHVMQISLFLLAEAKYLPANLVQSTRDKQCIEIDLRLEKYDPIAQRFRKEEHDDVAFLKDHIETKNAQFETLIKKLLFISSDYDYPILMTGRTGVGKSTLAKRVHELRKLKHKTKGSFVSVNCGTLTGDVVRSELFGHRKGAFTGATNDQKGLLKEADGGTLFLDEIGELDLEVQKMLLTAIEDKEFRRLGDLQATASDFYLIAGTNSDLSEKVKKGEFREDLLARIDAFHFELPELKNRPEDIEPNLNRELQMFSHTNTFNVTINDKARENYLKFAKSEEATWNNNFRDLKSSVTRMAAYAKNGRITQAVVDEEIQCLRNRWRGVEPHLERFPLASRIVGEDNLEKLDLFDLVQMEAVLEVCRNSSTRAEAGRKLFNNSRQQKSSKNDTTRLNNYLARNELDWESIMKEFRPNK
jgi:transcriptional regulatory protein RtcR